MTHETPRVFGSFHEVDAYLASLPPRSRAIGDRLSHVRSVLDKLGNPQDKIPAIHVAGTSGKGSTSYYVARMLSEAGYEVGLTVSPHVSSVAERAQVNAEPLAEPVYCRYVAEFIEAIHRIKEELTYIEFVDIFAYWLFAKLELDYMVIEVGLGGRLDPTNVMTRSDKVAVITDIGLDHVEILGDTLEKIAAEKAGIIALGNAVVMQSQPEVVTAVIADTAQSQGAELHFADPDTADLTGNSLPLFQRRNWSLAYEAVRLRLRRDRKPPLDEGSLEKTASASLPGRFETFAYDDKIVILDAAHNPQKIAALVGSLAERYGRDEIVFVVAFGENKRSSMTESLALLHTAAESLIATEFALEFSDAHEPVNSAELCHAAKEAGFSSLVAVEEPTEAVDMALHQDRNRVVVVTGSFYLISNVRERFTRGY